MVSDLGGGGGGEGWGIGEEGGVERVIVVT